MQFWVVQHDRLSGLIQIHSGYCSQEEADENASNLNSGDYRPDPITYHVVKAHDQKTAYLEARNLLGYSELDNSESEQKRIPQNSSGHDDNEEILDDWTQPDITADRGAYLGGAILFGSPILTALNLMFGVPTYLEAIVITSIALIVFSVSSMVSKSAGYKALGIAQLLVGSKYAGVYYGPLIGLPFLKAVSWSVLTLFVLGAGAVIGVLIFSGNGDRERK